MHVFLSPKIYHRHSWSFAAGNGVIRAACARTAFRSSTKLLTKLCLSHFQGGPIKIDLRFITARCYASAVLAMALCLSVTSRCSTKTAKRRITQTTPHDSPGTLDFWRQKIFAKFDRGHPLWRLQMQVGWVKIGDFWQITGYISKTVQDRHMVSIISNRKSYALYRMVTLRWHCKVNYVVRWN